MPAAATAKTAIAMPVFFIVGQDSSPAAGVYAGLSTDGGS
jgi:hypothetical protein